MEGSPAAAASENEEDHYGFDRLPSGLSLEGNPAVEVVMPRTTSSSPETFKRVRASISNSIVRAKKLRSVVGSPASRFINQMTVSAQQRKIGSPAVRASPTTARSPRPDTTQNSCGAKKKHKPRKLKSVYWKEFDLIHHNVAQSLASWCAAVRRKR